MKRIPLVSLLIMALSSFVFGQSGNQVLAQNAESVTSIASIPLSDSVVETTRPAENGAGAAGGNKSRQTSASSANKRYWVSTEYLLWRIKDSNLPPLVTQAGPLVISPRITLFGGSPVSHGNFSGGRITAGLWLNQNQNLGLEGNYFSLASRSVNFQTDGSGLTGNQRIGRSYIFAVNMGSAMVPIIEPLEGGIIQISIPSRLRGAEANLIYKRGRDDGASVNLLAGFRYLDLKERLTIFSHHVTRPFSAPFTFAITDEFTAANSFYGGQVGARPEFRWGRVRLEGTAKVALGSMRQEVEIDGFTFFTFTSGARLSGPVPGGVLALTTNIGSYSRNRFAVVPELNINLGYQFNSILRAFVGYDFLYANRVVRPGDQIDPVVNFSFIPFNRILDQNVTPFGEPRPSFSFRETSFWAQGLTVGLRFGF